MTFTATKNIPDGPNNPSDDQPIMKINNNSFIDIWDEDHWGFNLNTNGGKHDLVSYPVPQSNSPGTGAQEWREYTKLFGVGGGVEKFWQRPAQAAAGPDIQITVNRIPSPAAPANITPDSGQFAVNGGVTYLPGGIVQMFGQITNVADPNQVLTFPQGGFPNNCFGVWFSVTSGAASNEKFIYVAQTSLSKTGVQIFNAGFSSSNTLYWFAIGN